MNTTNSPKPQAPIAVPLEMSLAVLPALWQMGWAVWVANMRLMMTPTRLMSAPLQMMNLGASVAQEVVDASERYTKEGKETIHLRADTERRKNNRRRGD